MVLTELVLIVALWTICCMSFTTAQESINAQDGFEVGKQAGISLAICFSVLAFITITVNVIKYKCVKKK
jgi:hypothetical protein